jgi:hypothetical protein
MKKTKKCLALLLVFALVVGITSCSENTSTGAEKNDSEQGLYDSNNKLYSWDDLIAEKIIRIDSNKIVDVSNDIEGALVISPSVTSIGDEAFCGCSGLTSIEIPNSVTSIGYGAFEYCSALTSIIVNEGNPNYDSRGNCNAIIETESNTLIRGCQNTEIASSVTSIGDYAFSGCSGLTSIEIPNSVTSIGFDAFSGCSGLTGIEIPNSVTSIGDYAFSGCSGLTSIEIPNSVTSIGYGAFEYCSGLTSITVNADNPNYDSRDNCNAIIETESNTLISGCQNTEISNTVTSMGDYAFKGCSGLMSIEIPNSVTGIGDYAFSDCSGLTSIKLSSNVTIIGDEAFSDCSGLTNIKIPSSVTHIGLGAFKGCSGLASIEIPNSVTSIGDYAFEDCSQLTSIYCQAESQPSGWDSTWLNACSAEVAWGYTGN